MEEIAQVKFIVPFVSSGQLDETGWYLSAIGWPVIHTEH
jgi:hypothetical protein